MDNIYNFPFNSLAVEYLPDWMVQNQNIVGLFLTFVIPCIMLVIMAWRQYYAHCKLVTTPDGQITEKRMWKKVFDRSHIFTFVIWFLLAMNWLYIITPNIGNTLVLVMLLCLIVLPIMDVHSSSRSIGNNYDREANLVARYIIRRFGWKWVYVDVCIIWIVMSSIVTFATDKSGLPFVLMIVTVYIGLFASNFVMNRLYKDYPNIYFHTGWVKKEQNK